LFILQVIINLWLVCLSKYIYMMNHLEINDFECAGCSTEEIFCSTIPCHVNMFSGNITGNRPRRSCRTSSFPVGVRMGPQPSHSSLLCKFASFFSTREIG
jgi:hypothetical protein